MSAMCSTRLSVQISCFMIERICACFLICFSSACPWRGGVTVEKSEISSLEPVLQSLVKLHLECCVVLGPSFQKEHWEAGTCPKKGSEGSRKHVWWVAEGDGGVNLEKRNPGEKLWLSISKEDVARWGLVSFAMSQVKGWVLRRNPERTLWGLAEGTDTCECLFIKGHSWGVVLVCLNWTEGFRYFLVWVTEEGKSVLLCVLSRSTWKIHG